MIMYEIYLQTEDEHFSTIKDALKRIAEICGIDSQIGFVEAEEQGDGFFKVLNTCFFIRHSEESQPAGII